MYTIYIYIYFNMYMYIYIYIHTHIGDDPGGALSFQDVL